MLLGVLLNVLDGVSYGMIMFPANAVFPAFGGVGVSMFFVTTIIAQLAYSCGASGFAGANGSMMIEVVPFFHILAADVARELGEERAAEVVATTLAAFALSAVLTGLAFFALGGLRLGAVVGFFPRHILVGCIGGVGVFLIETGLTVCARIDDDDFTYTLDTLKFFLDAGILARWLPALALAVLLRAITHRFHHQLIFPAYFLTIPVLFYAVVGAARLDVSALRRAGWLFDMGGTDEAWYTFYSYYSFKKTSFRALWVTMPTQFALLFFNILHPPLNVPALAVSLDEDVDTNKELVAHGYSNLLAGLFGVVPNYLVYVNTLLFYRVGGTTRVSGFLLALATFGLLVAGTAPIGYIPIMLVGSLIFVLGIDLVKEALWDTRHRVSRSEYLTIASIMVCMTLWDFVVGVLFGIVVCCFFFVVQNSRRRSIRALFTGECAMSAVRRPSAHRDYIREVARQTVVLRLQGFLFFGTITQVEAAVRRLLEPAAWAARPVRFVVLDLALVAGTDLSAAEAFVRIQRLLAARGVTMVLCGLAEDAPVGAALRNVGLLEVEGVELFEGFGDAMEWTENAYLRAWFMSQKSEADMMRKAIALPGRPENPAFDMGEPFHNSPRRNEIYAAAGRTLGVAELDLPTQADTPVGADADTDADVDGAFLALSRAFSSYAPLERAAWRPLLARLARVAAPAGTVLWEQGAAPDGLYVLAAGVLRARYGLRAGRDAVAEVMVGGTLAGELSALAGEPRNARVVVERDALMWRLGMQDLEALEREAPELARTFVHLVLKVAKTDYDILLAALAARQ
ncbi:sulfate anion transporter [Phellopilus nigrolimitatus]|nr:sulfate anion transporter [Phellopilus nigrolimitatus]